MSDCGRECYRIGGPFIAEDPDCPAHGREAQARERRMEPRVRRVRDWVGQLVVREQGVWDPQNATYVAIGRPEVQEALEVLGEQLGVPLQAV